jgi:hypothetical protein
MRRCAAMPISITSTRAVTGMQMLCTPVKVGARQ